ncbi:translation initiation factor IF3 [Pseudohyphozyma bogoriensis]|nr:translation initiation factor IF3 [Pseudohyphozyma bogoriensis]
MLRKSSTLLRQLVPRRVPLPSSSLVPSSSSSLASAAPRLPSLAVRYASSKPTKKKGNPTDEEIPFTTVALVDPTTSSLLPPAKLADLLASLDRTRFTIVLADQNHEPPICRIVDKKAEFAKEREKKAAKKEKKEANPYASSPPKEIHLSWGTTKHDLGHKLGKAKDFLSKGQKVTVYLNVKKGAAAVDQKGKQDMIDEVQRELEAVGRLMRPTTFKGGQAIIEFERIPAA